MTVEGLTQFLATTFQDPAANMRVGLALEDSE